jgi:O-antigen/teichoic acid export membrane protein
MRRDLLMTLATRSLLVGISMVTAILTARLLGPAERGEYFLAVTITAIGVQLLCLGLQSSNVYFVAGDRQSFAALHSNSIQVTLLCTLVALSAGAAIVVLRLTHLPSEILVLAFLGIPPALYYLYGVNLLLGAGETATFNRFELLARISPLLLMIAVIGWASAFTFVAAGMLASSAVAFFLFRKIERFESTSTSANVPLLQRSLHYGAKVYIVTLLGFLVARLPVLLLGISGDSYEVGQLSVALQIADMMALGPATVAMLLFPRLVQNAAERDKSLVLWIRRVAIVMLPGCVLAGALCDPLIPWVFGGSFRSAIAVMYALLPGVFFLSLISILSQYLAATGMPWSLLVPWLLGLTASIALSRILIPLHGAEGAAASLSIAYAVVFLSIAGLCVLHYRRATYGAH